MQPVIDRRQLLQRCACVAFGGMAWARYSDAGAQAAPPEMTAREAAPGCWYVEGLSALGSPANANFISNAGFIVTSAGVVVVDALGDTQLVLQPVGPAHTPEDLAVYLPGRKVLYAGDLVFRSRIPFVGQADSRNWIVSLDKLLAFDTSVIIPGHGPVSTEARKDMQLTRDYLIYLRKTMGAAARDMTPFDEAYKATDWSQYEHLPLFGPANRMNAYNTYLLMEHDPE